MDYTVTELITSLKMRGLIPTNSEKTFSDDDLIRFMSEELMTVLVPKMMTVRENYFLTYSDVPIVANQAEYQINPRAIGMKIKLLYYLDSNGNQKCKLQLIDVDNKLWTNESNTSGEPQEYYFIDNFFHVSPPPNSSGGSFRQYYFQRRNELVSTQKAGQIVQIVGNDVEINFVPEDFIVTSSYDFVKGTPGFQNLAIDQVPTGISSTVFTFTTLPAGLAVGDWLCLAGQSPIPQVPLEMFPVISQTAVAVALMAMNDQEGADTAFKKRSEMLDQSLILIGSRAENNAKVITSHVNIGNALFGGYGFGPWLR